jgi:hypothetical protein
MASDVNICNLALQRLGASRILSLSDNSTAARAMNILYTPTRDSLLRQHPWNFAVKRASLAADSTAPAFGYDNAFTLPADCLRLLSSDKGEGESYMDTWKVEDGKILTNEDGPLYIRYVSRVADPTKFDACFLKLFALKLALDACEELTQSTTKFQILSEEYKDALKEARRLNAFENPPADSQDGSWISSRI